jgi:hypothetical protein
VWSRVKANPDSVFFYGSTYTFPISNTPAPSKPSDLNELGDFYKPRRHFRRGTRGLLPPQLSDAAGYAMNLHKMAGGAGRWCRSSGCRTRLTALFLQRR